MGDGVVSVNLERLYALYRSLPEFQGQLSIDEVRRRVGDRYLALVYNDGSEDTGFKLGYAREPGEFYSWLGGVSPASRGRGIAQQLLEAQEAWAIEHGFDVIRVRSRNCFPAMLRLLIRNGYLLEQVQQEEDLLWSKIQFSKSLTDDN